MYAEEELDLNFSDLISFLPLIAFCGPVFEAGFHVALTDLKVTMEPEMTFNF